MRAEQQAVEKPAVSSGTPIDSETPASTGRGSGERSTMVSAPPSRPKRFHGTVRLDPGRVVLDAGRVAKEVIAHLEGQVGARVTVTLEIEAELPDGAPEYVVRAVTENSATLKFEHHAFEVE